MMIRGVRAHRERQPLAIHNREDLDALAPPGIPDAIAPTLCRRKGRIDETLALTDLPFVTQRIGQLRQDLEQHFALAPLLKAAMHRLVVGDHTAAAGAMGPRCSKSGAPPPRPLSSEPACGPRGSPGCVPRENVPESVPIGRRAVAACTYLYLRTFRLSTILR